MVLRTTGDPVRHGASHDGPPMRYRRSPAGDRWAVVAAGVVAAALLLAFVAPEDRVQGEVQRLMYLHVPVAWTAYLCFAVVLGCGLAFLRTEGRRWDLRSRAFAEAGVVLTALTLVTGGIWGQATWGTWWTWDARLVSTVALLLVYVGQLAIRHVTDDARRGARWAAVTGMAGFAMVPVVHFSVLWWRTLHQPPTILGPSTSPPIDAMMALALAAGLMAVMAVAGWVIRWRYAALRAAAAAEMP